MCNSAGGMQVNHNHVMGSTIIAQEQYVPWEACSHSGSPLLYRTRRIITMSWSGPYWETWGQFTSSYPIVQPILILSPHLHQGFYVVSSFWISNKSFPCFNHPQSWNMHLPSAFLDLITLIFDDEQSYTFLCPLCNFLHSRVTLTLS
jgi:hypothetical protein